MGGYDEKLLVTWRIKILRTGVGYCRIESFFQSGNQLNHPLTFGKSVKYVLVRKQFAKNVSVQRLALHVYHSAVVNKNVFKKFKGRNYGLHGAISLLFAYSILQDNRKLTKIFKSDMLTTDE